MLHPSRRYLARSQYLHRGTYFTDNSQFGHAITVDLNGAAVLPAPYPDLDRANDVGERDLKFVESFERTLSRTISVDCGR